MTPTDWLNVIPAKYHGIALTLLALSPIIGRAIQSLRTGGGLKGMISGIWLGTNTPKPGQANDQGSPVAIVDKRQMPLLVLLLAIGIGATLVACKTPQLEQGGAYAPANVIVATNTDGTLTTNAVATQAPMPELYLFDAAYKLAYDTVDGVFKLEFQNRADVAKMSPAIKPALDKARITAWEIDQRWAVARKAYKANPTPAGLTTLQLILAEIQKLVAVVQSQFPVAVNPQ